MRVWRNLPTAAAASRSLLGLAVADAGPEDLEQDERHHDDEDRRVAMSEPDRDAVRDARRLEAAGDIPLGVIGTPVEELTRRVGLREKQEKERHRETSRESELTVRGSIKITMKNFLLRKFRGHARGESARDAQPRA